ncbi:MAG: heme ABC exporter ATP-binding protein CcmA [Panacagrimonas sp.]
MSAQPLLLAQALRIGRGDRVVLPAVDLRVDAGDLLLLKGPNGVGKTSLLEVLAGLRKPLSGSLQRPAHQAVHWVGHRNAIHSDLSPVENLRYWCELQGCPDANITAALARLQVRFWARRASGRLSAGQRRRIALARLLIEHRPLWLLDEPMSALDVQLTVVFGDMLGEHLARGGAAILTSHQALPGDISRLRVMELA